MPKWLLAIRKALGALTDLLLKGRQLGLYDEKGNPIGTKSHEPPLRKPGVK